MIKIKTLLGSSMNLCNFIMDSGVIHIQIYGIFGIFWIDLTEMQISCV